MASDNEYYNKLKYRCNHPESDFTQNTNPIEMKKEDFVEYTKRNEVNKSENNTWGQTSIYVNNSKYTSPNSSVTRSTTNNYNRTNYSTSNYATRQNTINQTYTTQNYNQYKTNSSKKSSLSGLWIILFIWFGLPIIFSILSVIFEAAF